MGQSSVPETGISTDFPNWSADGCYVSIILAFLNKHFSPILEKIQLFIDPPYNNFNEDLSNFFH